MAQSPPERCSRNFPAIARRNHDFAVSARESGNLILNQFNPRNRKKIKILSIGKESRIECVLHKKRDIQVENDIFVMRGDFNDNSTSNDGLPLKSTKPMKGGGTSSQGSIDSLEDQILSEGIHRLQDALEMQENKIMIKYKDRPEEA